MSTQQDINAFRAQRIANTHDPLALMANTQTPCHPDHSSLITYIQHPQPNNNFVPQPSFNTNYMPQPMQNLEDSSDPTTAMNKALALLAKTFKVNTIPTNNNQRSSLIPRNSQIAQQDMNTSQDIKMQMVDDNIVENMNGLSVVSEIANQYGNGNVVTTPAEGNGNGINGNPIRCYNCRGEGHYASNCTVKPRKRDAAYLQQQLQIAQEEEAGIQSTQVECKFMAAADAYEETERVKVNCTLEDTLQQASTSGTQSDNAPVYDSDGSTEKLEDEKVSLESQVLNYAKENAHLKTTYKNLFDSIKVTQAQTNSIIDSLQKQLYDTIYDNAKLRAQLFDKVSERKGTTKGTRTNTMFTKQSILGKPPSSSYKPKLYSVTPFPKSSVLPKVDKTNALSKPVTSNSAPSTRESKGVQTVKVIASRIFRTNHSKTSRVDNVVPNKPVKSSVRTKPITASQPNVIHRQQANSNSSGFSPTRVNNTAKTISPQPARVHSKSKSSCLSNNFEKLEENHRNSLIPKTQKHKSSECNNIKLAVRNAKLEVVCAMCKQCFVTGNHDVCMLNYVNDMNSRADNQSANVSKLENQKKHKANVRKSKELGSQGSLASSRPSKPRNCLRWVPTGRIFAMCGKLTASSNTENKSDKSVCDNASTSNPSKPSSKGFSNSTSLLGSALYLKKKRNLLVFTSVDMIVMTSMVELESLFGHLFDELSNGENQVVSKSSDVTTADAFDKRQQQQDSTSSTSSLATTISADGNFDL
ncbi:reverse transcriptase domain-containing protein [Tanacetum coccineum]